MNKQVNCAEELTKLLSSLEEESPDLFIVERECLDSWDENGGIFMIYLMEEDYRDYDALWRDIINEITDSLKPDAVAYGKNEKLDSGLLLNIHHKSGGLAIEFEFYRVKNGRAIPRND